MTARNQPPAPGDGRRRLARILVTLAGVCGLFVLAAQAHATPTETDTTHEPGTEQSAVADATAEPVAEVTSSESPPPGAESVPSADSAAGASDVGATSDAGEEAPVTDDAGEPLAEPATSPASDPAASTPQELDEVPPSRRALDQAVSTQGLDAGDSEADIDEDCQGVQPVCVELHPTKTSSSDEVTVGEQFDWTVDLENLGPMTSIFGIKLYEYLPADYALDDWSGSPNGWNCQDGTDNNGVAALVCVNRQALLNKGQSAQLVLNGSVTAGSPGDIVENCVKAWAIEDESWAMSTCDTVTITGDALVGVDKEGPSVAGPGEIIDYEITVPNASDVDAIDVVVVDRIPLETEFVSVSHTPATGFDCAYEDTGREVVCTGALLEAGEILVIEVTLQVADDAVDGAVLTNTVTVDWTNRDSNIPEGVVDTIVERSPVPPIPPTPPTPPTPSPSDAVVIPTGSRTTQYAESSVQSTAAATRTATLPFTGADTLELLIVATMAIIAGAFLMLARWFSPATGR